MATAAPATTLDASAGRLEARGLQKTYGARMVVKDVRLSVNSGEVVGLLGPNGAGKTTSFYMIVGLVRADMGEITLAGQRVERLPIHQRSRLGLSYLPQEASIFRKLTVAENIRAVLELQHGPDGRALPKATIDKLLSGLLHDLSIEKLRDSPAPALAARSRAAACSTKRPHGSIRHKRNALSFDRLAKCWTAAALEMNQWTHWEGNDR